MRTYNEFLILESAPRLPKSEEYWIKKGKSGKNVCLIFHDDMDGIVSAIIMKNYLTKQGFNIKKYGVINYQEGWAGFRIEKSLITIALDFADNIDGVDYYVDHHGQFDDETRHTQKRYATKTQTGSAAEGIAQQLGVPFSNDTKDWIDMIDSARYSDYLVDIKGILDFDLKTIVKDPQAKLKFAAGFNQLIKRSDHRTFIEVVNASDQPSVFNIYRLFKLFYTKHNPNHRTGNEVEFVEDAKNRLDQMTKRTRGDENKGSSKGFDEDGKKIRYLDWKDFWSDFAKDDPCNEIDDKGNLIIGDDGKPVITQKWQVKTGVYQIIGNLMYVPSGTWANALRAKSLFAQDQEAGIVPKDSKLNFVLLQYGNTLQLADLTTKIQDMNEEDLPKNIKGEPINNLGKYTEKLVKNFEEHLDYKDERTVSGGHKGIGTISNIFGKCKLKEYENKKGERPKYLDMFKNKIINDISGVKWSLTMPWNEKEEKYKVRPEEVNKKLVNMEDVRTEEEAHNEKLEREILNYLISGNFMSPKLIDKFQDTTLKKIYQIWIDTKFNEIDAGIIKENDINAVTFKPPRKSIEDTELFKKIVEMFGFDSIYQKDLSEESTDECKYQRKQLKRIFRIILNMFLHDQYIKDDTKQKVDQFLK